MTDNPTPFNNAAAFYQDAPAAPEGLKFKPSINDPTDKRFCRHCLQPIFDSQDRSTPERGFLRTRLMMADNGNEVACCDNCWHGAIGAGALIHGKVVPTHDPMAVPSLLLRAISG